MKKLFVLLLLLGMAAAIGYLLGTEEGRARRDELLARYGGGLKPEAEESDDEIEVADEATESTSAAI